jgi:hypothetical protein
MLGHEEVKSPTGSQVAGLVRIWGLRAVPGGSLSRILELKCGMVLALLRDRLEN